MHQLGSIALVFISVSKLSIYHLHVCHLVLTHIKPKEILRKSSLRLAIISKLLCNFWAVELHSSKFRILESEFEIIIFDILIGLDPYIIDFLFWRRLNTTDLHIQRRGRKTCGKITNLSCFCHSQSEGEVVLARISELTTSILCIVSRMSAFSLSSKMWLSVWLSLDSSELRSTLVYDSNFACGW